MQYLMDYEDKKFQNVSKEGLKLKDSKTKELKESFKGLTKWWKNTLASDNVEDVKISSRLADTPCVVVTSKYGWSAYMEKIMHSQTLSDASKQAYMRGKRVLEINPRHPIIKALRERVVTDPEVCRVAMLYLLSNSNLLGSFMEFIFCCFTGRECEVDSKTYIPNSFNGEWLRSE